MKLKINDIVILKPFDQIPNAKKEMYDYYANKLLRVVRITPFTTLKNKTINVVDYEETIPNSDNICKGFCGTDNIVINIKEGV